MKLLRYADIWLMVCVFMRLSHWVDWRFHRNQYDLARYCMSAGIAMNLAVSVQSLINNWHAGLFSVLASSALTWAYTGYVGHLRNASRSYERQPDRIPREAYIFILVWRPMRLSFMFIGTWMWVLLALLALTAHKPTTIISGVGGGWMVMIAAAWYIAAGIPPTRERKKKPVRIPAGATLARHG